MSDLFWTVYAGATAVGAGRVPGTPGDAEQAACDVLSGLISERSLQVTDLADLTCVVEVGSRVLAVVDGRDW